MLNCITGWWRGYGWVTAWNARTPWHSTRESAEMLSSLLAKGPPGFLDGAWCSIEKYVRNCGQYLTFTDEFWSLSVITGKKLVTNCNLWAYIWIFWRFQPVSGELRPFQWSSGQIGSFLSKFVSFWAVLGSFLAFSRTLHFYSLILTYKKNDVSTIYSSSNRAKIRSLGENVSPGQLKIWIGPNFFVFQHLSFPIFF